MAYCQQVTKRERGADRLPAGYEFRLPTEAQWEYACRAATKGATAHGENLSSVQANFDGNYPYGRGVKGPNLARTAKVGSYLPNAWGLSDMHGNVREWCSDWYRDRLPGGSVTNPIGPATGSLHVYRSGDWNSSGSGCRSAFRGGNNPEGRSTTLGFRLALVAVP